jgi:DinB superfamily
MHRRKIAFLTTAFSICALGLIPIASATAQKPVEPPAKTVYRLFTGVNDQVLTMAEDFPEDKYDYRPKPEMRSFGEVIIHIASGNVYAAKKGRGENVNWDELDPKNYKTKAEIVAMFRKSIDDATSALKAKPEQSFAASLGPWLDVVEHSAEHYGLLVAYYRLNGLVPPASRPKK